MLPQSARHLAAFILFIDADELEDAIDTVIVRLGRYMRQPISELEHRTFEELVRYHNKVIELITQENTKGQSEDV